MLSMQRWHFFHMRITEESSSDAKIIMLVMHIEGHYSLLTWPT